MAKRKKDHEVVEQIIISIYDNNEVCLTYTTGLDISARLTVLTQVYEQQKSIYDKIHSFNNDRVLPS